MEEYGFTIGAMPPQRRKFYLGQWIRCLNLKQVEVAEAAKISESYLSQLISNPKKNPKAEVLLAISEFLKLTVNDLYDPPPVKGEMEATQQLSPRQSAALGALLTEMGKRPKSSS